MPHLLGLEWEQSQEPGSQNVNLPCGWQEPNDVSHYYCLPGSALVGNWSEELELRYPRSLIASSSPHLLFLIIEI